MSPCFGPSGFSNLRAPRISRELLVRSLIPPPRWAGVTRDACRALLQANRAAQQAPVPPHLAGFALLRCSSLFSTLTAWLCPDIFLLWIVAPAGFRLSSWLFYK